MWFIPFDAIFNPDLVPMAVASVFDIRESAERPVAEALRNVLRSKTALLILDNCEHLLEACTALISPLLTNCLSLKILATSRESLGIMGEAIYRVPSLKVPNVQESLDSFRASESVYLFKERARLAQFDFCLTLENATSIARICQHLDGIPLAIELAAAKVTMLSVEQIADQLHENFACLHEEAAPPCRAIRPCDRQLIGVTTYLHRAKKSYPEDCRFSSVDGQLMQRCQSVAMNYFEAKKS